MLQLKFIYLWIALNLFYLICTEEPNTTKIPLEKTIKSFLINVNFFTDNKIKTFQFYLNTQLDSILTTYPELSKENESSEISSHYLTEINFLEQTFDAEYNEISQWSLPPSNILIKNYRYFYALNYNPNRLTDLINNNHYFNALPLSYYSMNKNILQSLIDENIIKYKSFILLLNSRFDSNNKSFLVIGETPQSSYLGKKFKYSAHIQNGYWKCKLNKVSMATSEINYEQNSKTSYISIQASTNSIYINRQFFELILKEVFLPFINNKSCLVVNDSTINCACSIVKEIPPIVFEIEHYQFSISSDELFEENDYICYYLVKLNSYNNDHIVGLPFLEKYTTFFDVEESKLIFYSSISLEPYTQLNNGIMKNILIFNIILLIIFISMLVFISVRK